MPETPTQRRRMSSIDDMENRLYSSISETQEFVDPLVGNNGNDNEEIDVILILAALMDQPKNQ